MFNELEKYTNTNHFFFKPTDSLKEVCNAPTDKSGIYIVYALKNGRIELIYIGSSGKKLVDGNVKIRKSGLGGIKDRLVNGHHFGKIARKKSWPIKMLAENIEALDVYWWITYENKIKDCPLEMESMLLHKYFDINGNLPKWNKALPKKR